MSRKTGRSKNLRILLLKILGGTDRPLQSKELSYIVESTTRYKCSPFGAGILLLPLVKKGIVIKIKIVGEHSPAYAFPKIQGGSPPRTNS